MNIISGILNKLPRHIQATLHIWKTLSKHYGHYTSAKEWKSTDGLGLPIPWYTYPCIDFLRQFDFSEKEIFEFGSGYSTLFWGAQAKSVVSVEADQVWFNKIHKKINKNVTYIYKKREDVPSIITEYNKKFDIIIVDSCFRNICAQQAVHYLKDGGIIILDNSDWHQITTSFLRNQGMTQIDFIGFTPIERFISATSIFFHGKYNLKNRYSSRPYHLMRGIDGIEDITK